jgi:hypothetical protein
VPVYRAHSESVNIEFERSITPAEARAILAKAPGLQVVDDPANKKYPMPIDASGMYDCLVGRIRQDVSRDDGRGIELLNCWKARTRLVNSKPRRARRSIPAHCPAAFPILWPIPGNRAAIVGLGGGTSA